MEIILSNFSSVHFSRKMNIFRDIHQKRVPTGKTLKIRKMPKIHLNDLVCSSFEREFNGEHFIPAHEYTFSGEK
jgi:hypothetical protein